MNSFVQATRLVASRLLSCYMPKPNTLSPQYFSRQTLTGFGAPRPLNITSTPQALTPAPTTNRFGILRTVQQLQIQPVRTRVYQSFQSSKPKTIRSVPERFMRLGNGLWIRTKAGRHKHLWKKSRNCRRKLKQHVICNKQQTRLLDRMVCQYWTRHRHYPDDPYAPYHKRNNFQYDKVYDKAPFYPL